MLNTRDSMREGMNERTYTATKHITTLLLRSRVKWDKLQQYVVQSVTNMVERVNEANANIVFNLLNSTGNFY